MLRTLRHQGRRLLALLAAVMLVGTTAGAYASDQSLDSSSTMAPRIAPQDFSIDATIASMVQRGLLLDLKPSAASTTRQPTTPRPAPGPRPEPAAPRTSRQWRSSGSTAAPGTLAPTPLGWRPAGQGATASPPPTPTPSSTEPSLAPPQLEPEMPVADPMPGRAPELMAGRPDEPIAEPQTSDDPLPDDALAPIDELPETPVPADDAPGDPRESEIGDEELEGVLLPPANSRQQADAAPQPPTAGSLSRQSLTPVGEPDRIEEPDETVTPPSNPESYQEPDDTAPPKAVRPLSRNQRALRDKVRRVLKYYYSNPLNTGNRSPWEVMHCMLAYEVHSRVLKGGPQGEPITAVGWLCFNQPCKGRTLMYLNQDGDMRVKVGPALQGHHGQLLALLAQARVRTDYPMKVEGKDFTVADLIEQEKATCYPRTELTFKLIGLQRYLDINAKWMNDQGMQWDFPTLLREEMRQPVRTAACGGTHRLSGLMLTVKKRQRSGLPVDGEYAAAQKFVQNYVNYAYRLQNPDGSFSTEWFKGPGAEEDIDRRLKTTGHQLEFLIYAGNDQALVNFRTVKAVNYLSNIMWANRGRDWEAGPLGHAVHALVLYDRLVFAPHDHEPAETPGVVARQPSRRSSR